MKKKLRIAFVVHTFPIVSETFILNQIIGLIDRGHCVDVFALSKQDEGPVHEEFNRYNLKSNTFYVPEVPENWFNRVARGLYLIASNYHKNPGTILRSLNASKLGLKSASLRLLFNAIPFLGRGPYDIVHVHFGMNGFLALEMRKIQALTGKLIVSFHGYDVNVWPRANGNDCYQELFQQADLLTVSSDFIAGRIITLGAEARKIARIPVGVDLLKYGFRESSPVTRDAPIVLTVGRLVEVKGLAYSIRAFAKLLERFPKACYWIVGDGPLRSHLQAITEELGISKSVRFFGTMTCAEVTQVYKQAHIFLLAGVVCADGAEEGQGLVLLEAQAIGLPVVATRVGGIPESVVDGQSGFLVAPQDTDALVERLSFLIERPEIWPEMGRAGRSHVEAHYNIDRMNDRLVEVYMWLVNSDG